MVSRQSWPWENRAADRQVVGALCITPVHTPLPVSRPSWGRCAAKYYKNVSNSKSHRLKVTLEIKPLSLSFSPKEDFNIFMASALSTFKPIKGIFEHSLVSQDTAIK